MSVRNDMLQDGRPVSFINIGVDYPDADRFTFVMEGVSLTESEEDGSDTGCGGGEIYLFNGVAQMRTDDMTALGFDQGDLPPPNNGW